MPRGVKWPGFENPETHQHGQIIETHTWLNTAFGPMAPQGINTIIIFPYIIADPIYPCLII